MLSVYLDLTYEFQLLQVKSNKFILTLETQMPSDYACAVLDEAKMIHVGKSSIMCYPTDEYAEGYFGGDLAYNMDDQVAEMSIQVQMHALPLHLRTIKVIKGILIRYCIVQSVNDDCLSSKKLDYTSCACRAQKGTMLPKFIIITVDTRCSGDLPFVSTMSRNSVQTYCIPVTAQIRGTVYHTPRYQLHSSSYFARAVQADRVVYCFLREVDICGPRIKQLEESVLLIPRAAILHATVQEITEMLQSTVPDSSGTLIVQSIGVQGYIARSICLPLPRLLQEISESGKEGNLCSHAFSWIPWSTSFGAVQESLTRKIIIQTMCLPTEFLAPEVVEDLLSPFCMFETSGYDPGSSPDIHDYRSVVWTKSNMTIPSIIQVYAAPMFCEITEHPKGEVVELTVRTAYNTGIGLEGT